MSPAQNPPVERHHGTISLAPRIYEGGGPRSGRGSSPAAAGTALSVTASPCQLPQRGSRGRFAPFLPPAFMRGEGHAVAGGVPHRSGKSLLSHGFAVPAPPEGKPRALRTVLAPRIYEGGGPRSGRGSPPAAAAGKASSVTASPCQLPQRGSRGCFAPFLPPAVMRGEFSAAAGKASSVTASPCQFPQRGSQGRFAPFLPPAFMRGEGHAVAGGVSPPQRRGKPPQSRLRRASSPKGRAKGASHRSCPPHL